MPEQPVAIGVDIGGTAIKLALVDGAGVVLAGAEIPAPLDLPQDEALRAIGAAVTALVAGGSAGEGMTVEADRIAAIGIGCAGLVSSDEGIVHTSPNLPHWREVPLRKAIAALTALPTFVLNDANAFALAEARIGAGAGCSPVVALTLGTGIGGALVVSGELWGGAHGFAGEIGHTSIDHAGRVCPCGNRGCLELYVGRRGLVDAYLERVGWRPGEVAYDLAGGRREAVDPKLLAIATERGDAAARAVFQTAGELLGVGLANLSNLLDPELFVVGGGVAQAGDLILAPARQALRARAMIGGDRVAPIRTSVLGPPAGVIGAALFAQDRIASAGASR